ncbi:MAG: GNAT family N-acetyltransferase [Candidatus Micrarchaeota archaeon]
MNEAKIIELRPVREADIKKIFEWRNDQSVRANSFQTSEIKWEEHTDYWEKRLRNRKNYSYIVVFEGKDSGLVRLDNQDGDAGTYEANILISPEFQGKGVGIASIAEIKKISARLGIKKLIARVKPGNIPSQKIFEKNGFVKKGGDKECVSYACITQ